MKTTKIVIIGAGIAGITCAIYLKRANKDFILLDGNMPGGKLVNLHKIENYPGMKSISGFDYATNLYKQVINLGGEIRYEMVTRINDDKTVFTDKNELIYVIGYLLKIEYHTLKKSLYSVEKEEHFHVPFTGSESLGS